PGPPYSTTMPSSAASYVYKIQVSGRVLEEVAPPPSGEPQPWLRLAAAVLLALFAAGAVRQSVVNRRPMENRS
ncbi:hypothetical protein KZ851_26835, partial [Pseudomonas aeruginosa]|uniref:hypothetical protein n=1 Tax=Pseudomonas aeruginosa TaxID=287 RepID=UPI001CA5030F